MLARQSTLCMLVLLLVPWTASVSAEEGLRSLLEPELDVSGLRERGPEVMEELASLYRDASPALRDRIASAFYRLGWQSEAARRALMNDIDTENASLRISVQYALGRVSGDDRVVETLLRIMRNDGDAYFRDKAACALAYDQPHLDDAQKAELYAGLIRALDDPKAQVRSIAIKALKIHTGQTKGYRPGAPASARQETIRQWRAWLAEYRAQL